MTTLVVIDRAPYGDWSGREALDMAFALAAFDQPVSLLFLGAGVAWLRPSEAGSDGPAGALGQKAVHRNLSAAPVFGVDEILACRASCERFGVAGNLVMPARPVDVTPELYAGYDHITFAG
ncbi:DsrE family protein [Marinobacter sp. C2H3]|uniref:DsrE family protein n=1 Tax=Marinobacter sp. C2H3 TaxID=3119003 RepID=UPI00300E9DE6